MTNDFFSSSSPMTHQPMTHAFSSNLFQSSIHNPQSSILNPQSTIHNPQSTIKCPGGQRVEVLEEMPAGRGCKQSGGWGAWWC
jgi:hypothetical protein